MPALRPPGAANAPVPGSARPMRIFIVENHEDTRFLLQLLLEQLGHTVLSATTLDEALEVIPDEVIDELIVWGTPQQCRAKIDQYFDNGVTTSSLALLPLAPFDFWTAVRELAPSSQVASPI